MRVGFIGLSEMLSNIHFPPYVSLRRGGRLGLLVAGLIINGEYPVNAAACSTPHSQRVTKTAHNQVQQKAPHGRAQKQLGPPVLRPARTVAAQTEEMEDWWGPQPGTRAPVTPPQ